jgi:hypothetical protein
MRHIFKYTERDANTRQPLRRIKDIDGLRELLRQYWALMEIASADGYYPFDARDLRAYWTMSHPNLPKKSPEGADYRDRHSQTARLPQTPREFLEGMIKKVHEPLGRNDLSPRQCEGTEQLSKELAELFNIPNIVFVDQRDGAIPQLPDCFERPGDKK